MNNMQDYERARKAIRSDDAKSLLSISESLINSEN